MAKQVLMIVANEGYQDFEYERPKGILEAAGFEVVTAAKEDGEATGKLGGTCSVDIIFEDVDVFEYEAVLFVGGPGAVEYIEDVQAHMIARDADAEGKVLGAICIAPLILAHAEVLKDKDATVWDDDGENGQRLDKLGAHFVDEDVVVDGNLVTANGPDAAEEFGAKIVELLQGESKE